MYQFIETNQRIGIMAEDKEAFVEYAKSKGEWELLQNVDGMLNEYDHSGYHGVYNKFKDLIDGSPIKKRPKADVDKASYQKCKI